MELITHFQVPSDVDIDIEFIGILYDKNDINRDLYIDIFFYLRKLQFHVCGWTLKVNSTHLESNCRGQNSKRETTNNLLEFRHSNSKTLENTLQIYNHLDYLLN